MRTLAECHTPYNERQTSPRRHIRAPQHVLFHPFPSASRVPTDLVRKRLRQNSYLFPRGESRGSLWWVQHITIRRASTPRGKRVYSRQIFIPGIAEVIVDISQRVVGADALQSVPVLGIRLDSNKLCDLQLSIDHVDRIHPSEVNRVSVRQRRAGFHRW